MIEFGSYEGVNKDLSRFALISISLCAKWCEDDKRQIYKHCLHGEALSWWWRGLDYVSSKAKMG